jgi:hypothetical protein
MRWGAARSVGPAPAAGVWHHKMVPPVSLTRSMQQERGQGEDLVGARAPGHKRQRPSARQQTGPGTGTGTRVARLSRMRDRDAISALLEVFMSNSLSVAQGFSGCSIY